MIKKTLAVLMLPMTLSIAFAAHAQETADFDSNNNTNTKEYAEGVCLTWAKEDNVPQRKLEEYLSECIAEIIHEEEKSQEHDNSDS